MACYVCKIFLVVVFAGLFSFDVFCLLFVLSRDASFLVSRQNIQHSGDIELYAHTSSS